MNGVTNKKLLLAFGALFAVSAPLVADCFGFGNFSFVFTGFALFYLACTLLVSQVKQV